MVLSDTERTILLCSMERALDELVLVMTEMPYFEFVMAI